MDDYPIKSVLIVDNSPVITRLIKNYLVEAGFAGENIILANDGNQAIMMLELKHFDLVTTSMHIKGANGVELLSMTRGNSDEKIKNTPFLFISSERKEYLVNDLEKLNYNGYLQKPFTYEQLVKSVNDIFHPGAPSEPPHESDKQPALSPSLEVSSLKLDSKFINPFIESTIEALGQYMTTAVPGSPLNTDGLSGDFSSIIDLTDKQNALTSTIVLSFPKNVACKIYAGIFGEVDMEQVCGVVQELGNIIAGIVKPKISDLSHDIYNLVYPGQTLATEDEKLNFQLGLPIATMKDNHSITLDNKDAARFTVPFDIDQEKINLLVQFQKYNEGGKTISGQGFRSLT